MENDTFFWRLLQRLQPRIGWLQLTLALAATLCAAVAASDSTLKLPSTYFTWAGGGGLLLGLRLGRAPAGGQLAGWRRAPRLVWAALLALALLAIGALLIVAAANTLPPLGLLTQDLAAYMTWLAAILRRTAGWADRPEARAAPFVAATMARFWRDLLAAPGAGEAGARLIVLAGGLAASWLAALALGWALARGRNLFVWALPTLGAIAFTTLVGGAGGSELIFGMVLLLLLLLVNGARLRERAWDRRGADYSDELGNDTLGWGAGCVMAIMVLALIMPTSVSNPLAQLFWRDVELPSGIAVLERNLPRQAQQPQVPIGISRLPALQLGQSLEKAPPGEPVLRVKLSGPLVPGPWPRYWRARVFNFYTGRDWTTNARVDTFAGGTLEPEAVPGGIVQEIEDLRGDRAIVAALPDVVGISMAAHAERLPDGSLAALTADAGPARYRVLSRPQEQAAPLRFDTAPPDLSSYLALPKNYPQRVLDLARVVVGARTGPYQQALALEEYLRELPYTYAVQPVPANGDAVEQFLFDMRQGYCTYYASAMAVMARSLGIPARLAIGYATGEYDQASGTYLVRQSDAHAWAELYIDGRWLPFEPTPIRALPARGSSEELPTPVPAPAPAPQPENNGPLTWALVLAVLAGLAGLLWWRARPRRQPTLAIEIQQRIERAGVRAGVPWPAGATLREYGALLAARAASAGPELHEVADLVGEARYSGHALRAEQEGRLRRLAESALARLPRRREH